MNFRGLYKWAGLSAIGFAALSLTSYIISIVTNGAPSLTQRTPDQIWNLLQRQGNQINFRLELLSYFLWIPALVGLYAFLRERRPGRAHLGAAFVAFGLVGFFASSALASAMLSLAQQPATDALRERVAAFDLVSFSIFLPALYAVSLANLLWGLALRTQEGLAKTVGTLFLIEVAAFILADAGFIAKQPLLFNAGIVVDNLALAAVYTAAGLLLRRASTEEGQMGTVVPDKPRAAGASA